MIVIYSEEPDAASKLAAIFGNCYVNNELLTLDLINNNDFARKLNKYQMDKGYFDCKFDNKKVKITWGYGHLAELKNAKDYDTKYKVWKEEDFPFIPQKFQIKIKKDDYVNKQFKVINELFNDNETELIINATDSDREGQLIFHWVKTLTKTNKPCMRLWLNSYTEEEVINEMHNLKSEKDYDNLTKAAKCRSIADWMVGANLTAVGTCKYGSSNNTITIGRVQTAVLNMIVQRENNIKKFKNQNYYVVETDFTTNKGKKFTGIYITEENEKIFDKSQAEEVKNNLDNKEGIVTKFNVSNYNKYAPYLYDLTTLQMDANSKYGLSAKETLEIAQKLYRNQYISYPRTNSRFLPSSKKAEIRRIIDSLPDVYSDLRNIILKDFKPDNNRIFDDSKVKGHYALIPTYKTPSEERLSDKEIMVYGLIVRSILKAYMTPSIWENIKVLIEVGENKIVIKNRKLISSGWKIAEKVIDNRMNLDEYEEELNGEFGEIESGIPLSNGMIVKIIETRIIEKTTRHPSRYTEKSLLSAMETCGKRVNREEIKEAMKEKGIGTAATRAAIIESLINNRYIKRTEKELMPTDKAIKLIEKLPIEEIKSAQMTGEWEYKLSQVESGEMQAEEFYKLIKGSTVQMTELLKTQEREYIGDKVYGDCPNPECGGKIIEGKKGYGCSNYKNGCKFVIWKKMYGVDVTPELVVTLLAKKTTGKINCKSKFGKSYYIKLKLDNTDGIYKIIKI